MGIFCRPKLVPPEELVVVTQNENFELPLLPAVLCAVALEALPSSQGGGVSSGLWSWRLRLWKTLEAQQENLS